MELRNYDKVYGGMDIGSRLLWLRLLKLADETMILELKIYAYERVTNTVPYLIATNPASKELVAELFDSDAPQPVLQEFFAWATAYILFCRDVTKSKSWIESWNDRPEYMAMILDRVLTLSENRQIAERDMHPLQDAKLSPMSVFGQETD